MENLVNFDSFADVANNVINKISAATSWVATRETPQKIAINTYIEEIQKSDHDPLTKAALISNAKKTIREYSNQANIVQKAIPMLTVEVHTEEVSDDWIAEFMDKARLVSDEDFQVIWAKILAGEMEKPGSYSLRTLGSLKNLSKTEASLFMKLASLAFQNYGRFYLTSDMFLLNKYNAYLAEILKMEECGLISAQALSYEPRVSQKDKEWILFGDMIGLIKGHTSLLTKCSIPIYMFTDAGNQLANAISIDINTDFAFEYMRKMKTQKDFDFSFHKVINRNPDGSIEYEEEDLLSLKAEGSSEAQGGTPQ